MTSLTTRPEPEDASYECILGQAETHAHSGLGNAIVGLYEVRMEINVYTVIFIDISQVESVRQDVVFFC